MNFYRDSAMKKAKLEKKIMKKAKLEEKMDIDAVGEWLLEFCSGESYLSTLKINDSKLQQTLFKYFSDIVPSLLCKIKVGGVTKFVIDEEKFEKLIPLPLEQFICGSEGFSSLQCYSKAPKFCGRTFNVGDPTYSCSDCAADSTCVFCHECFHNSSHTNHKYKLHASHGHGGYCDCGDKEAWATEPACDLHKEGLDIDVSWDPLAALPRDIKERAAFMFIFLLQYCVDLLCWNEHEILPEPLASRIYDEETYIVMMFNDESHTYDEVINTLQKAVKCTQKEAVQFATIVDKEGRSAIYTDSLPECKRIVAMCRNYTSPNGKKPLKCEAIHRDIVAHQLVAVDIMKWLIKEVQLFDGLRRLLSVLVSQQFYGRPESLLRQVILADTDFWKVVRGKSHQLFMNALLMDIYGRNEFAIEFAKCYKQIMRDFINDDHEHGISVASLSVQIFTVPTIAEHLSIKENILKVCLETFWDELKTFIGKNGYLDFQNDTKVDLRRADFILTDLKYLLTHKPKWTIITKFSFLEAFDVFLEILKVMQGMDSIVRKTQTHITYEPNWESGFNLQLWIIGILELMLSRCCSDVEIFKASLNKCITALRALPPLAYTTVENVVIVKHDVTTELVSIHATLSRFIAGLIPGITKFSLNLSEMLQLQFYSENCVEHQLEMMEYSLRVLILLAQVNGRMWKRNGYAILHQLFHYQNVRFASEMFDRDILLLQTMSAVMDSNHFLDVLLHKYNVKDWSLTSYKSNGEKGKLTECLAEELFLLLLYILSERYVAGLSEVKSREILEREVVHRLSLGPSSRSVLVKTLPSKDPNNDDGCSFESMLDDVLKKVAVYREPGLSGKGLYELKKEELSRCNQFFLHFSKIERSKMLEERKKIMRKKSLSVEYLPVPPKFLPQFEGILHMLCCERMEYLLTLVLNRAVGGFITSDELIEEVLLIVAVGLLEVKRGREENIQLKDFKFLEMIIKQSEDGIKNISSLLEDLCENSKADYFSMVKWIRQLLQTELEHADMMEIEINDGACQDTMEKEEKSKKAKMAQERRERMMAQMKDMQKAFMKTHSTMFTEDEDSNDGADQDVIMKTSRNPVAIGVKRFSFEEVSTETAECILCHQEEEELDADNSFVVTSFVHNSKLLQVVNNGVDILPELNHATRLNVSSCGHVLHGSCWEKYFNSIKEKEGMSFLQHRKSSCIDITLLEYLCPLCNFLCNTVLPLLPRHEQVQCANEQDMMLTEFLTYLERFTAKLMCLPKPEHPRRKKSSSSDSSLTSTVRRLYHAYIRSESSSPQNFMEMFATKLLKASNVQNTDEIGSHPPLAWMACSFTLQALECCHRNLETNVFYNLSERQRKFWFAFIQSLESSCHTVEHAMEKFAKILFNFFCGDDSDISMSIITADVFGMMISLRFLVTAVQNMFQEGSTNFMNFRSCLIDDCVFKICLVAYLVKVYIASPTFIPEELTDETDEIAVVRTWRFIHGLCKSDKVMKINGHCLKEHVVTSLLPFLRCATIFFHFRTGIKLPDDLKTETLSNELELLLTYLNLPDDVDIILSLDWLVSNPHNPQVLSMIKRWCSHDDVKHEAQAELNKKMCYVEARTLISLPHAYSSLIKMASGFRCPTVGDCSRTPSMCLICGTILCSQCYCCVSESDRGACAMHSIECANGVGIFLRVRQSEVLLMFNGTKGAVLTSPYLDQYGEPDRGFRRGNPLFLNTKRYEQLQQLWLQHRIPETIAQQMEMNRHLLLQDWEQQ